MTKTSSKVTRMMKRNAKREEEKKARKEYMARREEERKTKRNILNRKCNYESAEEEMQERHKVGAEALKVYRRYLPDIVQHINRNFMQKITLDDVSKQFYISRFYLSKTFKETTGFTFVEYLNSVRIKEAQKLLIITNKKIIQISYEVGFGSVAHFGRVFKTITGYSPLQYRKLNKTKK
jgi:YesN/AraC family two-component response regulator